MSHLEPLVNKEDHKKACLQSVEHHPSTILSLAELAWISRHPVIKKKKKVASVTLSYGYAKLVFYIVLQNLPTNPPDTKYRKY